jgi:hypothetical protein
MFRARSQQSRRAQTKSSNHRHPPWVYVETCSVAGFLRFRRGGWLTNLNYLRAGRKSPILPSGSFSLLRQNELACGRQLQPVDVLLVRDDQEPFASKKASAADRSWPSGGGMHGDQTFVVTRFVSHSIPASVRYPTCVSSSATRSEIVGRRLVEFPPCASSLREYAPRKQLSGTASEIN